MDSKSQRMPMRLVLAGAGAAILLAATVLVGLYLGGQTQKRFQDIDHSWRAYTGEAERRGELLSRIRAHLGYGGIIHNFKNYVLRKDRAYLTRLNEQLSDFTRTIAEYRASGATDAELGQLKAIEQTINTYKGKILIATQAAREDWPPERTDRLVKVDDTAALAALASLDRYWRDKRRETTRTIAAAVQEGETLVTRGFRYLGGLVVVALVIYGLFYLLQRELRQTIGLLSGELTERKAAQFAAKKFQYAVDQSPATIIITDTDGRIEYVNHKFCNLTGYQPEEVLGETPKLLQSGDAPPQTYANLRQQLIRGEVWRGTFRNRKKDGELYWAKTAILPLRDDEGRISHFIGLGEDITERRQARDQIHRAQKMEAVGLLASGVAHDFNNVLTTILGNVHLARLDAPAGGEFDEELEQIEIAAKRARNLVGQVLAFARRQPGEAVPVAVSDTLQEVARLMQASIQPNVRIVFDIENQGLTVRADPTRLHQVIMNLCSNAAEAIGPKGGTVVLGAYCLGGNGAGRQVCIEISDDGPGIPEDVIQRIFDPFFTTKPPGKGTGLGLSVVANLVTEMGGEISVESEVGEGSRFTVTMPEADDVRLTKTAAEQVPHGSGTVLLIDDEPEVVATCAKVLRRLDYLVEAYTDPVQAMKVFEAHPDRFSLVMTDFVMPDMNGELVCKAVRELCRDCPIILYTAYQPAALELDALQPIQLLEKPVDPALLAQTVHGLINAPAPGHDHKTATKLHKTS